MTRTRPIFEVRGLPAGTYKVSLNQASLASFSVKAGESHNVKLALAANGGSLTILRD